MLRRTLKKKALWSFKISVSIYQSTKLNTPEVSNLQQNHFEYLTSYRLHKQFLTLSEQHTLDQSVSSDDNTKRCWTSYVYRVFKNAQVR